MRISLLIILSLLSHFVPAQIIEGKVYDSLTGEPVQFANVYFAKTSRGTVTSANGAYMLPAFGPGKYNLTVSFVGYHTFSKQVEIDSALTKLHLDIVLTPEVVELSEIYVRAGNENWEINFRAFTDSFLGRNPAAGACEIINPEALYFYNDEETGIMHGHASDAIHIMNEYLGYHVYFDLESFEYDHQNSIVRYTGVPRYEKIEPDNRREAKNWAANRLDAYYGSMLHFFRSLHSRRVMRENFVVSMLFKNGNSDRERDSLLITRLKFYDEQLHTSRKKRNVDLSKAQLSDSVEHYSHLFRKVRPRDSVSSPINLSALLNRGGKLNYRGFLQVEYFDEASVIVSKQSSEVLIREPIQVFSNGYVDDIRSIYVEGYWAHYDTIATMLPLDYQPAETEENQE